MEPIVKWAGGKRQLLPELKHRLPNNITRYVEPFIGGGALFFDLNIDNAVINDTNKELINVYTSVRDMTDELLEQLQQLEEQYNSLSFEEQNTIFYKKREEYNISISNHNLGVREAALFIFLNKTCYNGLYRVNSTGSYNTPFGQRKHISLYNENNIRECAERLRFTRIMCGDFESACKYLRRGSFVYFDSPYYDTFDTYQAGGFNEEDHKRLARLFRKLTLQGVNCMLSNSDTTFIRSLYQGYHIETIDVKRMINCDGKNRSGKEIIVTNY